MVSFYLLFPEGLFVAIFLSLSTVIQEMCEERELIYHAAGCCRTSGSYTQIQRRLAEFAWDRGFRSGYGVPLGCLYFGTQEEAVFGEVEAFLKVQEGCAVWKLRIEAWGAVAHNHLCLVCPQHRLFPEERTFPTAAQRGLDHVTALPPPNFSA